MLPSLVYMYVKIEASQREIEQINNAIKFYACMNGEYQALSTNWRLGLGLRLAIMMMKYRSLSQITTMNIVSDRAER